MAKTERVGPISFSSRDKVAIVAGNGALPVDAARELAAHGHPPLIVRVKGERLAKELDAYPHDWIGVGEFLHLVPLLKRHGVTHVILAGGISRRPKLPEIKLGLSVLPMLPRVIATLARGDDVVLRTLVDLIERGGIRVVGVHEIVPELLAPTGTLTKLSPTATDLRDIEAAREAALRLGELDIGQGAIAVGGRVVAVEGIEGTDGLLKRMRDLRTHPRLAGKTRGVLVKCAKPQQELRVDLPTVGPETVDAAHAAGLAGIGVQSGHALLLDAAETIARADRLGLFIVGIEASR